MQIQHGAAHAVASLHQRHAGARQSLRIIRGSQQARLPRKVIVDFALVPDVIAAGQHVNAVTEQFIGQRRSDAEASGRVFAVGDGQVNVCFGDDSAQLPGHNLAARGCEDIANEKKISNRNLARVGIKERTTSAVPAPVI